MALRIEIMTSPELKTYEINTCIQSYLVKFKGANKQFSFPKISLVYDKSDQHTTLYDSYNAKLATTFVGFIKLENSNNNYSISSKISFDLTNGNGKYFLYRQFVAW